MELNDFFNPLIRWWKLILAATLVAAVFSFFAAMQQPAVYRSQAILMIGRAFQDPNPSYYQFFSSQQLASTYADIAYRKTVRDGVMDALGINFLPIYTVQPIPNTDLLEISVNDSDPARAQAVANELANQLIQQSPTNQTSNQEREDFIQQRLDILEVKIDETQADIDAKQEQLPNLTSARQISDLQNQIAGLQAKLDGLQLNYASLLANTEKGALNSLTLIEPAYAPTRPIGPNKLLLVITSSGIAFMLAAGAAYLLSFLDNTIKSPEEIKRLTGLSTLGAIPTIPGEENQGKLITMREPRSPISEAFRALRTGIQFSTIDRTESTSIQVTSSNPGEGKSVTTANLAAVMAQAGLRVLIIDADLRRPMVHKIFGMDNRLGLTDFFRNLRASDDNYDESFDALRKQLIRTSDLEGLSILTSGSIPPNPSELLGSNANRHLIKALKKHYDYLIIDSPPVLIVTDAVVLSTEVDGTILVVDSVATHRNQLKQAAERLNEVNATMLGVVVNRLSPKADGFYGYISFAQYRKYEDSTYGYSDGKKSTTPKTRRLGGFLKNRQ